MSDTPESIEVTYSAADIAALNLVIWAYWLTLIGIIAAALIAAPIIIGLIDGYSLESSIAGIDWSFTGWVLLALVGWLLLVVVFRYWQQRRQGLLGPIEFTLTEDGVSFRNRQMNGQIFWKTIKTIRVREDRAFLFMTKRSALIFPRRAFASDGDFRAFVSAAEQRWKADGPG